MNIFLQGLVTGLAYVAPVGTQNIYVINSSITQKTHKAIFTVLMTALMDISLALVAYFGMGALFERSLALRLILFLVGGMIVMRIGISLMKSKGTLEEGESVDHSYKSIVFNVFSVTWLNPQAIIDGAMLLGSARLMYTGSQVPLFIGGVNTASLLWFFTVFFVARFLRKFITPTILTWINRISGAVIVFLSLRLFYNFAVEIIGLLS